jgi:hypothetical protein
MRHAVVFLCKDLSEGLVKFANEIKTSTWLDVWIVADNKQNVYEDSLFSVFHCSDEECIESGYRGCNITGNETHIKKSVIAWDKFLYKFCNDNRYDFYWVFEDDVFIPSVEVLKNLDQKYSKNDLVVPNNFHKSYQANDWHWQYIVDKISPPYFHSMVAACGMSRKMFDEIKKFADTKRTLFHIEAMFNTLAMQNKELIVADPFELKSVVWQGLWGIDEFLLLPNNVFHPIKQQGNENLHEKLRNDIKEAIKSNYKPINNLPDFLRNKKSYV